MLVFFFILTFFLKHCPFVFICQLLWFVQNMLLENMYFYFLIGLVNTVTYTAQWLSLLTAQNYLNASFHLGAYF